MRKNTLAYSCLPLVLAVPMPSIADNLVELRPDDPVYVKLGKKSTWINAQAVMGRIWKGKLDGATRWLMACGLPHHMINQAIHGIIQMRCFSN